MACEYPMPKSGEDSGDMPLGPDCTGHLVPMAECGRPTKEWPDLSQRCALGHYNSPKRS